ncbi:SafA/ExsA family spore coat assembly protein [Niallia oryzisoli]|uniref:SafA/ExsA family spore coat assembly protein n=1 Tax=Niallia oryzisoli TaxID=1737571 RepID=A0ABZ2CN97_9BACI
MKIHIVQKGDTLWKIAKKYGVNFEELKKMNSQLSNPDMIMPGMKIKVPTSGGNIKKEAPTGVQGTKINMSSKKEMPKQEIPISKEIIKEKPKEMPKPVEVPKAQPIEAPKPKPVEAPKAKPIETPKPVPKAKPIEIPKPVPKAKPIETPKPVPIAKPIETPKPVPKAKPIEAPKEVPKAKPIKSVKEVPKEMPVEHPYPPKMPQPVPEIDVNNYYMMNMANVNVKEQQKPLPQLPPKPVNVLPEVKPVMESPVEESPIMAPPIDHYVGGHFQPMYPYMPNFDPCFDPCFPGQPMPFPQVQGTNMPAQMPFPQVQGAQMPAQPLPYPPAMGVQMPAQPMPCPPMPYAPMYGQQPMPQVQGAYMPEAPMPNQPSMVGGIQEGPDMYDESSPYMPQMYSPMTSGEGMPATNPSFGNQPFPQVQGVSEEAGYPEMGAQPSMMPGQIPMMEQQMPMMGQPMPMMGQPMPMMGQPMPMMGQPMPMMGQQMPYPVQEDCGCGAASGIPMGGYGVNPGQYVPPMMPGGFYPGQHYPQMGYGQLPYDPYMQAGAPEYGAPYGSPYDFGPGYPPRDEESSEYNG